MTSVFTIGAVLPKPRAIHQPTLDTVRRTLPVHDLSREQDDLSAGRNCSINTHLSSVSCLRAITEIYQPANDRRKGHATP